MRFRLRTMLAVLALVAAAGGGARVCYDRLAAPRRADEAALAANDFRGVTARWSGAANGWLSFRRRAVHLWLDDAAGFEAAAERLGELTAVDSVQVLGRQIVPHAAAFQRGEPDGVIEAWRRHPALREVLVDASVRGAPLVDGVKLYDREDLATLQAALPEVKIVWMEVH
jgi:hypothetical protein